MVAFKEEFPYLRCESGQLFEFDQAWLRAEITRAADRAGYPSWRNDEPVVPFSQLSQTVRYVLNVIGYKEIVPFFAPAPPPISFSLLEIALEAGAGYELAFFDGLEKRIAALLGAGADTLHLYGLQSCVKHLRGTKTWSRPCDALREEVVCFVRERLTAASGETQLRCFVR